MISFQWMFFGNSDVSLPRGNWTFVSSLYQKSPLKMFFATTRKNLANFCTNVSKKLSPKKHIRSGLFYWRLTDSYCWSKTIEWRFHCIQNVSIGLTVVFQTHLKNPWGRDTKPNSIGGLKFFFVSFEKMSLVWVWLLLNGFFAQIRSHPIGSYRVPNLHNFILESSKHQKAVWPHVCLKVYHLCILYGNLCMTDAKL